MRRLLVVLVAVAANALGAPIATADGPVVVSGCGTGTFGADLDDDGDINLDDDGDKDGSHFGFGAGFGGGVPRGHFMCQMAGNADILGLPVMLVEGHVSGGWASPETGTALLTGHAIVNLAQGVTLTNVPYEVRLFAGGPGVGRMQLTVIGAFDGVPGDTVLGNGNYDLPVETVATGRIKIQ
jgi:hypothetical protein